MFEEFNRNFIATNEHPGATIKVIGVGGAGTNAVNKMFEDKLKGVEFFVANTDVQSLKDSKIANKIILGESLSKGLGAGANPDIGKKSAQESIDGIKDAIGKADLIFIAAGMGGGTGTGASPIIAKAAKETGALVVGIVTTPFDFEGTTRIKNAAIGTQQLRDNVDSLIVISNNRLLVELGSIPLTDSFQYSDAVLKQAVRTITDLINHHSLINLDFADVKTVLENKGMAIIGTSKAIGENAAVEAAIQAINSPILESTIEGAKFAIVNVSGGPKVLTINQAQEAVEAIKEASGKELEVIFGVTIIEELGEEIIVSVIATGLTQTRDDSSNSSTNYKSILNNETDIEKYKDQTKEFSPNTKKKKATTLEEDLFSGLTSLDEETEETNNFNLEELLK